LQALKNIEKTSVHRTCWLFCGYSTWDRGLICTVLLERNENESSFIKTHMPDFCL